MSKKPFPNYFILRFNTKFLTRAVVYSAVITLLALGFAGSNQVGAATPGLPFTEDFTDASLRDDVLTNANWSTDESALVLAWKERQYGTFDPDLSGSDITTDSHLSYAIVLGDVDGDGDLDLVMGNYGQINKLYLNDGDGDPWDTVSGVDITTDNNNTYGVALGDVDNDGNLDLVEGNYDQTNRLYLNDGNGDPWDTVSGVDITSDADNTSAIALEDVDGDGSLDLVVGNVNEVNRLYLSDGDGDPWDTVSGVDITTDVYVTYSLAVGDVDNDGDLDLVTGNNNQINRLFLNDGTGDPWDTISGANVTADTNNTLALELGDVDGDGDLDLVEGNFNESNRLFLNDGDGDPWDTVSSVEITTGSHETYDVDLGDVDGDGDLDLVVGNYGQRNKLYLNDGGGDPWDTVSAINITMDNYDSRLMVLGDVDGDDDLDLVVGNFNQRNRLYLNDGNGSPWNNSDGVDITTDDHLTNAVTLGDVDNDGDLDLVVGNYGQGNKLYLNDGDDDPWDTVSGVDITSDTLASRAVALGDVDGDGDLDLVVGNSHNNNRLYLNDGDGDPWDTVSGVNITSDTHDTRALALGDVDYDGDLDLVTGNYNEKTWLYLNDGTGDPWDTITAVNVTTDSDYTMALSLGDVDADGYLDLIVGNFSEVNRLYRNDGDGDPWDTVSGLDITSDEQRTTAVALGDLDEDGDLDLVVGNENDRNTLYLNDGDGNPWDTVSGLDITTNSDQTRTVALGDVDNDGDLDLVAGNYGNRNKLYLNDGEDDPWDTVSSKRVTPDNYETLALTLGDVDKDGNLDLVVGNENYRNRLYLNNGGISPWQATYRRNITGDTYNTHALAVGDVDEDGDLDLVVGNKDYKNKLYLNDGEGNPWNTVSALDVTTDTQDTYALALGDVDRDGDLDLVVGNYDQVNRLYLNDGDGDPWDTVSGVDITTDSHNTNAVILSDVDRDGDLDLVVGNYNEKNKLYLNDGDGDPWDTVSAVNITTDAHGTHALALGDVDRDGDLDLIVGNSNGYNKLHLNDGVGDPWDTTSGTNIASDNHNTYDLELGDVDKDGDLDLVVGNKNDRNRLYLNDGVGNPWNTVSGLDITTDNKITHSIALADIDQDGDLDLVAGNYDQKNKLYLNDGAGDPWDTASAFNISDDSHYTHAVLLDDVDGNGDLDLIVGNNGINRMYRRLAYHTGQGRGVSIEVDNQSSNISNATLTPIVDMPLNTRVYYWLSNNGGTRWFLVRPGEIFNFPTVGNDLRWKAELISLSPVLTPDIDQIEITVEHRIYLPLVIKSP